MENIVYILGAGFSAPLNLPVMSNFIEKSKDLYFNDRKTFSHSQKVFEIIKKLSYCQLYYESDLTNIEEILSILEMQNHLNKDMSPTDFTEYIIDVINAYTPQISDPDSKKVDKYFGEWFPNLFGTEKLMRFYGYFVLSLFHSEIHRIKKFDYGTEIYSNELIQIPSKYKYSIITLNYDMLLENYCSYINKWHKIDFDFKFNGTDSKNNNLPSLIKLHGCISKKNIIPPTWNKTLVDETIKNAWELAYRELRNANHI